MMAVADMPDLLQTLKVRRAQTPLHHGKWGPSALLICKQHSQGTACSLSCSAATPSYHLPSKD